MRKVLFGLMICLAMATSASADSSWTGDTTGGPTFNRPSSLTTLSSVGTAVAYRAQPFWVNTTGNYFMEVSSDSPDTHTDPYAFVYGSTWTPAAGLTGLLALDDGYTGPFTVLSGSGTGTDASRIVSVALTANTQYYAVVGGFGNTDFGSFQAAVGDGAGGGTVTLGQVPEPSALLLVAMAVSGIGFRRRK